MTVFQETALNRVLIKDGSGRPIYIAEAQPGVLATSNNWRIMKITYTSATREDHQWASGNANFDKVANDYATYSYS